MSRSPSQEPVKPISSDQPMVLHLKLSGNILEGTSHQTPVEKLVQSYLGKSGGINLWVLEKYLEKVSQDSQVSCLLLEVEGLQGSYGQVFELRDILERFKASGKPLYTWLKAADLKNYLVASVGHEIAMLPTGSLNLAGPVMQMTYFAETLKKLGVHVETLQAGRYKSVFEPFTRSGPGKNSLVMYNSLEKNLRNTFINSMKKSRPKYSKKTIASWLKRSIYTAKRAHKKGVIDQREYFVDYSLKLEKKSQGVYYKFSDYKRLRKWLPESYSEKSEGVALIELVGQIGGASSQSKDQVNTKNLLKQIEWARNQERVKSVVLRVSSPGGGTIESDVIRREVERLSETKPLVVSMGGYAASGGYYVSVPARKIYAQPTTITGSIGVAGILPYAKSFPRKYGLHFHTITNSARKKLLNPGEAPSRWDMKIMQESVDDFYRGFLKEVANGRGLTYKKVAGIAEGRVWTGKQALNLKLVDELGGLQEAVLEAKILGGFDKGAHVPVIRWKPKIFSLAQCFSGPENFRHCFSNVGSLSEAMMASQKELPLQGQLEKITDLLIDTKEQPLQAIWLDYYGLSVK